MIAKGDFVKFEYTGRANGALFDTTDENAAKDAGIYNPRSKYGSVLLSAGEGEVIPGLDEAILQSNEGDSKKLTIPTAKAFGARDPDAVRLIPIAQFQAQNVTPQPGMAVELDGRQARVRSVSGGRVQVDFNHDLAGKDVEYEIKILKVFRTPAEKVSALSDDLLSAPATLSGDTVAVELSMPAAKAPEVILKKMRFIDYLMQKLPEVKKITFKEDYSR